MLSVHEMVGHVQNLASNAARFVMCVWPFKDTSRNASAKKGASLMKPAFCHISFLS